MRNLALAILCCVACGQTPREWIKEGLDAYKAAQYDEAIDDFKQAVAGDPKSVEAHLYLATALIAAAKDARPEFATVLELDPSNTQALTWLASLAFQAGDFGEARIRYAQILRNEPKNREAQYSLGVIAWTRFYAAYKAARERAGLKPGDLGPFKDPKLRAVLRKDWNPVIQDGIDHLQRAIQIDPQYDDAMSYLNLLIRERADLADNQYAWQADMVKAETWVKKAQEVKKQKSAAGTTSPGLVIGAPPPPPPVQP